MHSTVGAKLKDLWEMKQAMEFLVECRKAGGMITAEKFLVFLSAFQRVSRCELGNQVLHLNFISVPGFKFP